MIVFIQFIDAGDLSREIVAPLSRGYLEKSLFRFIITKKKQNRRRQGTHKYENSYGLSSVWLEQPPVGRDLLINGMKINPGGLRKSVETERNVRSEKSRNPDNQGGRSGFLPSQKFSTFCHINHLLTISVNIPSFFCFLL